MKIEIFTNILLLTFFLKDPVGQIHNNEKDSASMNITKLYNLFANYNLQIVTKSVFANTIIQR